MHYKLISLDIFQTLVDVSSINDKIWRIFLNDNYSSEIAKTGGDFVIERILDYFSREIIEKAEFETVKSVFSKCYSEIFRKLNIDFNHQEAAEILAHNHNFAIPYGDADIFMKYIEDKYTYIISSDADNDMISGIKYLKKCDKIFTSEYLKCYKMSNDNRFFSSILKYYGFEPNKILHIGDSAADIINPKKLGIKTCWINRNNNTWKYEIEPDYIFRDLENVISIL